MLILASQSPRRHELLLAAGIEHRVQASPIAEIRRPSEPPREFVLRMAREKNASIPRRAGDIILSADTVVAVDDEIFGKPSDRSDALRMLRSLSGRDHTVYTGIHVRGDRGEISEAAATRVRFAKLTDTEIEEYLASGEYADKAGAYAIQGRASKFVVEIEGCYFNVVGLPISLVYCCLKRL